MKKGILPKGLLIAALTVAIAMISGCGSKMEGTYSNGQVTLDLRSGGKAIFTMLGESTECTYKADDSKVMLDCTPNGEKVEFMVHDDGSLNAPGIIGVLKKSS